MSERHLTAADKLVMGVDQALETIFGRPKITERSYPAASLEEAELSDTEKAEAARLMRVNHVGEVCAQALYQSQAHTARNTKTRDTMHRAAMEENDHLDWCEKRIKELGGRKSWLNPFWYAGSYTIGTIAGITGDKWNLGFLEETEYQVVAHLDDHLGRLPENDQRSRAIVEQMRIDEGEHATAALEAGAAPLPKPIKKAMRVMSKVMTRTAHWV